MSKWLEVLGWDENQLSDLRFVGFTYLKQGKYDIALKFFEALVILSPNSAYDNKTLGALYLELGNNLMALNYIERAIKLEPGDTSTLLNRTKALFGLGYKKQGLIQARQLEAHTDQTIASQASALILAHTV